MAQAEEEEVRSESWIEEFRPSGATRRSGINQLLGNKRGRLHQRSSESKSPLVWRYVSRTSTANMDGSGGRVVEVIVAEGWLVQMDRSTRFGRQADPGFRNNSHGRRLDLF